MSDAAFVALTSPNVVPVLAALSYARAACMGGLVARRFAGDHPYVRLFGRTLRSETLFTALLLGLMLAAPRWAWLAGILAACACSFTAARRRDTSLQMPGTSARRQLRLERIEVRIAVDNVHAFDPLEPVHDRVRHRCRESFVDHLSSVA